MTSEWPRIILFISAGRCGTQWLAAHLADVYGDRALITHEPLGPHYRPRRFFRQHDRLEELAGLSEVSDHLKRVRAALDVGKTYVETGWPLFAAVPLFLTRFPGRVSLVHLTRHPIPSALSHMAHQCYAGSRRDDDYTRLAALDPFCPGVFQAEDRDRWDSFTPFEKCLFWWTEVHLYALELHRRFPEVPWTRIRSEAMLAGNVTTLRTLATALGFPYLDELQDRADHPVDAWHHRTHIDFDWRLVYRHPRTLQVAERLGYDVAEVTDEDLEERYVGTPHPGTG